MTVSHGRAGCPDGVDDPEVKLGVVGLPDVVRALGLAAMDEIERLAVALVAVVRERDHRRVQRSHDRVDGRVARCRPAVALGDLQGAAMDRRGARPRTSQRDPLDHRHELVGHAAPTAVRARGCGEPDQAAVAVAREPALCGSFGHAGVACGVNQRDAVFKVRAQHAPAQQRFRSRRLAELRQRRSVRGVHRSRSRSSSVAPPPAVSAGAARGGRCRYRLERGMPVLATISAIVSPLSRRCAA